MNNVWQFEIYHNTVQDWLIALGILAGCLIAVRIFKKIIMRSLKKWTTKTDTHLDDFLVSLAEKSLVPVAYAAAFYFAIYSLTLPAKVQRVAHVAVLMVLTYSVLRILTNVIRQFIYSFLKKQENSEAKEKQANGLVIILNVVIWIVGLIFLVDNLGYNVSTLIAGMGIGGIAIALAAQTILGDLFSYFVIFFDRPFEIGDFIIIDDKMGSVEYIGIKTTRLRTLSGEQLVCSNTFLTNAQVHNYKRMYQRRIVFTLSVTYQTTKEQLQSIPGMVKDIILTEGKVRFDRGNFSAYNKSSLDFEFVYYVLDPDYNLYMDIQERIYLKIFDAFNSRKIDFAYPTQTVYIGKNDIEGTRNNMTQNSV
ncbi:MAG: mechanosensitive ion channel family protein [Flavipsychrobacter sp.]